MVLLDTHIWLWMILGNDRLNKSARKHFRELSAERKLFLSAMSVWEASNLIRKGKVLLDYPFDHWIRSATSADLIQIIPLSVETVMQLHTMSNFLLTDPADRIIAATAIAYNKELATLDRKLLSLPQLKFYSRELE